MISGLPLPLARPRLVLALIALATALFGWAATRLTVDNTPDVWVPDDLASLADFREFKERFGKDSLVVVFADEAKPDSAEWRTEWANLEKNIRGQTDSAVANIVGPGFPGQFANSPLSAYLYNESTGYAGLAIYLRDDLPEDARGRFVSYLDALLAAQSPTLGELRVVGADVITHELDLGSKASLGGLSPIVFGLMCAVLLAATGSWRAVLAGLTTLASVSVIALGTFALAGQTLNLVVVTMPAILAVVTIAQLMHLICRFQSFPPDQTSPVERWARAIAETWRPCGLSAITTAAGFGAIAFSEIPPVRNLGGFTAIGVVVSYVLSFLLAPALLSLVGGVPARGGPSCSGAVRADHFTAWIARRAKAIAALGLLVVGVCAAGVSALRIESNILTFFPDDHRVPNDYRTAEENLFGLTTFELILEGPAEVVLTEATFATLERELEAALAAEPLLKQVVSPLFVADPDDPAQLQRTPLAPEYGATLWRGPEGVALRLTLAAKTDSSNACHALAERLQAQLDNAFGESSNVKVTGSAAVLISGQVLLLDTQVRSFLIALGVITIVIGAAFRSLRIVTLSLLPNLLPVVCVLGTMGLVGIPLNTTTVTVAGIALGLIVDDTIHFLHEFNRARGLGIPVREAISETLSRVGRPIVITSITVTLGFGAFAFAAFKPTFFFGLLIAFTSVTAMMCDLVILPALLLAANRQKNLRTSSI